LSHKIAPRIGVKFSILKCHKENLWAVVELFHIRLFDVAIVICTQQVPVNTRKYKLHIKNCTSWQICSYLRHKATYEVWMLSCTRL